MNTDQFMTMDELRAWVKSQPSKTIFRVQGWSQISNGKERSISARVTRAEFVSAADGMLYGQADSEHKVPVSVYTAENYRCCYVGA